MFPQRHEKKSKQSGFTLIELAIIMAIIAVLGAVGAVKFASMKDEAIEAANASSLANARSALAIALVKDTGAANDGKVAMGELDTYLEGTLAEDTDNFKWTVGTTTYTMVYTGSKTDIESITSVTRTN